MYKIHCLNNISPAGLALFDNDFELADSIEEADAILVRSADMHEIEISHKLKAVARAGAGVNNIPLDRFTQAGIPVFNTPGANANAVKELVICGMLLATRDILGGIKWVETNSDDTNIAKSAEKAKKQFAGKEVFGKTLGVIGLGAIGAQVACTAEALGMKIIGYDPFIAAEQAAKISPTMSFTEDLNELFAQSDYITLHLPANNDTKGMINASSIANMKDGIVILNFARGALVNNNDLKAALESGKINRYVTDFPDKDLVNTKDVIVIPHLGASTEEAEENCAKMAVAEIMDYLKTGTKTNCVNL